MPVPSTWPFGGLHVYETADPDYYWAQSTDSQGNLFGSEGWSASLVIPKSGLDPELRDSLQRALGHASDPSPGRETGD